MPQFVISLAGINIKVNANYPSTESFCNEFLTKEKPDLTISIRQADIDNERTLSPGSWSSEYLETLALQRRIADAFIDYDTLLFHGSALAVNGKAYIFTAPSGTGKNTHTRLWLDSVPGAHILNGDKPFLRVSEQHTLVCGSPWRGKENYGTSEILPLEAVCLLSRDTTNHIEPVRFEAALSTLIRQTYHPADPLQMPKVLQLIERIGRSACFYRLGCNIDPEAALVSSTAMLH